MLARLNVPYISAQPLEFQTLEAWGASSAGLSPVESTIMVAIPELDGAVAPMVFGGRSDSSAGACQGCGRRCNFPVALDAPRMQACPERAEALAARVSKLVALRKTEREQRKLAIVLFNFPPNSGAVGSAAYLSVFASLHNTLTALKTGGYDVEVPATSEDLRLRLVEGNAGPLRHRRQRPPPHPGRRPHPPRTPPDRDRRPMGPGARQGAEQRLLDLRAWARSSATCSSACSPASATKATRCGSSSSGASRRPTPSPPSTANLREDFGRGRGAALRHPRRPGIHAGQAGGPHRRLLARAPDRRSAQHLPLCRQQPVRRGAGQAPVGGDPDQLSDAAGVAGRALQGPPRPEGHDPAVARLAHRRPRRTRRPNRRHSRAGAGFGPRLGEKRRRGRHRRRGVRGRADPDPQRPAHRGRALVRRRTRGPPGRYGGNPRKPRPVPRRPGRPRRRNRAGSGHRPQRPEIHARQHRHADGLWRRATGSWPRTTNSPPCSAPWTATTSVRRQAATSCAPRRSCPPGATCTASTPS